MQIEGQDPNAEASSVIDNSITQLDMRRVQQLNNLQQVQKAKQDILQQERDRLSKLNKNDPRVQSIDNRLQYNTQMFSGLNIVTQRASIQTSPLPANSWRIQGYVYGPENNAVSGITVFFANSNKQWVQALGSACTDSNGYYSITLNEDAIKIAGEQPLFIAVSDQNKKIVYVNSEALSISPGIIDYQDIFFNNEECISPPEGTVLK